MPLFSATADYRRHAAYVIADIAAWCHISHNILLRHAATSLFFTYDYYASAP